jgi:MIP family channel proteins
VALAFGIALLIVVASLAHVSGAHVNPAVTIALAATGKASASTLLPYIGAQLAGAIAGSLSTWLTLGGAAREKFFLAATAPGAGVGFLQGATVEALVTFILVFVIISVATDPRVDGAVPPLAIGFALAAGVFVAGPVTGGSLNPVRTLGPAIVSGQFDGLLIYLVGPPLGAIIAAFVYDRFVGKADAP